MCPCIGFHLRGGDGYNARALKKCFISQLVFIIFTTLNAEFVFSRLTLLRVSMFRYHVLRLCIISFCEVAIKIILIYSLCGTVFPSMKSLLSYCNPYPTVRMHVTHRAVNSSHVLDPQLIVRVSRMFTLFIPSSFFKYIHFFVCVLIMYM